MNSAANSSEQLPAQHEKLIHVSEFHFSKMHLPKHTHTVNEEYLLQWVKRTVILWSAHN